jgi:putative DNA-invertase from lambdoid prophage Rac
LIRERTQAGLEFARKRGKKFGRPLVTDARQRRRIERLRASGHSLRAIADQVGVGRGTVERVLAASR